VRFRDGKLVADAAEERFVRIKHYCGLPVNALEYCLDSQQLTMADIDQVAIPSLAPMPRLNFLLDLQGNRREPDSLDPRLAAFLKRPRVAPPLYTRNFPLRGHSEIVKVEHHRAHAASAYYTSDCHQKQLVLTMDGAGDDVSIALWRGQGGRLEPLATFDTRASLGWFYSNVTEALGWWHGDGEGKTMGLAAYGDCNRTQGVLDPFAPRFCQGELVSPHDFGPLSIWNETGALQWHLPEASQIQELIARFGAEHIAAEAQRLLEDEVQNLLFAWLEREDTRNLSAAGGVMLNVKLNQRLWDSGKLDHIHIYPNPGDAGLAAGAALCAYYQANPGAKRHSLPDLFLGPAYGDEEIARILDLRGVKYRHVEDVESMVASMLAHGKIVGWMQGRMESGPRALGGRSILMSANHPNHKEILNARVKFREPFRPFCPSILTEKMGDYLVAPRESPFMITSFTCQESRRERVPAVVHVDQTMRPQTVKDGRFAALIQEFGQLTGEFLLLNTSMNLMGEPIVNHPREALRCFIDSGMDCLVLGNYLVEKSA